MLYWPLVTCPVIFFGWNINSYSFQDVTQILRSHDHTHKGIIVHHPRRNNAFKSRSSVKDFTIVEVCYNVPLFRSLTRSVLAIATSSKIDNLSITINITINITLSWIKGIRNIDNVCDQTIHSWWSHTRLYVM